MFLYSSDVSLMGFLKQEKQRSGLPIGEGLKRGNTKGEIKIGDTSRAGTESSRSQQKHRALLVACVPEPACPCWGPPQVGASEVPLWERRP